MVLHKQLLIAGVIAKLVDAYPALSNHQIKEILFGTVDKLEKLKGKVRTGGLVNEESSRRCGLLASKGLKMAIEEANYSVSNKVTDDSQSLFSLRRLTFFLYHFIYKHRAGLTAFF